jgi:hypothetical protein
MKPNDEDYLTSPEAIEYLRSKHGRLISRTTLDHCISSGIGPLFYRVNNRGKRFFKPKDLDSWMAAHLRPFDRSDPRPKAEIARRSKAKETITAK